MSATNSLHYQLCCKGAKYIIQARAKEPWRGQNKWSAVEIVSIGCENPDVWATNGEDSTIIEVKTSVADFRNDKKKFARTKQAEIIGHTLGNYRYYLCPTEIADNIEAELPKNWGLLVWDGKKISRRVNATYVTVSKRNDMFILCSILTRELGAHKIFNYRKQ